MANATIFANTAVQECTAKILRMNNSPILEPMQSLPKKFFLPTISPLFVSTSGYVNWSRKRNQVDVRRRRCFSCVVPYCELHLKSYLFHECFLKSVQGLKILLKNMNLKQSGKERFALQFPHTTSSQLTQSVSTALSVVAAAVSRTSIKYRFPVKTRR